MLNFPQARIANSVFHRRAQRNAFRRRDARLQSRLSAPSRSMAETQPQLQPALVSLFAAQTLATTVKPSGAVSSVVERLVYTEFRVVFAPLRSASEKPIFIGEIGRIRLNHVSPTSRRNSCEQSRMA